MPEKINLGTFEIMKQSNLQSLIEESKGAAADTRKRKKNVSITLRDVIEWIEEQEYDDYTKKELINTISAYPQGILHRYKFLVKSQLTRIQKEKNKNIKRKKK
jgi:hypothetical protein